MHLDARAAETPTNLKAEVCIAGGGAAGITLARELANQKRSVILLESGGFTPDDATQALYQGQHDAPMSARFDHYLDRSRLRYFGGTTNHWAGWCRRIQSNVFAGRDWVTDAAWPFAAETLNPFYELAAKTVQIGTWQGDALPSHSAPFDLGPDFTTRLFHYSPPTRFGQVYREELVAAPTVRLLTGANVTTITLNEDRSVQSFTALTLDKRRLKVTAKIFVLACGGIENARILLANPGPTGRGIGNAHDVVGRYFADHAEYGFSPRCEVAYTRPGEQTKALLRLYGRPRRDKARGVNTRGVFWLDDKVQAAERVLHFHAQVYRPEGTPNKKYAFVSQLNALAPDVPPPHASRLYFRAETAPSANNRVTLIKDDVDALGVPKVRLRFQLGEQDKRTLAVGLTRLAGAFTAHGLGRLKLPLPLSEKTPFSVVAPGYHHMGTTRAHTDPKKGVVSADLRVYDHSNLYVAGSSVFPSYGGANPTLTIVALAHRLAQHLHRQLKSE